MARADPASPAPEEGAAPVARGSGPGALACFLAGFLPALLARLVARAELAGSPLAAPLVGDAAFYDRWARTLAAGGDLAEPVLFQSPLYAWLLGLLYRLAGPAPAAVLLFHALLGASAAGLLGVFTRRLLGGAAGLAAGLLAALYVPWIWYDAQLHKTALALFLTTLLLGTASTRRRPVAGAAASGLLLGTLALARPNALVLAPAWAWRHARGGERRAPLVLLAFLLPLALLPTALGLRNLARGGGFQPLAGNGGVNLYQGNARSSDGLYTPLVAGRADPTWESADALALAEEAEGRALSPGEVQRFWAARAWEEVRADPARWLELLARKLGWTLSAREVMDTLAIEAGARHSRVLALAPVLGFGTLLPLAALGLAAIGAERRRALGWLLAGALLLALSIVLFLVVGRLRAGLVPLLVPFAGAGLVELWSAARAPARRRLARDAAALGLAALATRLPLPPLGGDPVATTYANLAAARIDAGQSGEAQALARRALEHDPGAADAWYNLGAALAMEGELPGAEQALERAARLEPAFAARAFEKLGALAGSLGELERSERWLRRAVAQGGGSAFAWYDLGLTLRRLGRAEEALAAYDRALALRPDYAEAHHNRAFLLEHAGRAREAAQGYARALACEADFAPSRLRLAWLFATTADAGLADPATALAHARRAQELSVGPCELADTLACALAANGRFEEATALLEPWARAAAARGDEHDARALSERLRLYEAQRPLPPGTPGPLACDG